jgi:hypothetical protein
MMQSAVQCRRTLLACALAGLGGVPIACLADPLLTSSVNSSGGVFTYSYTLSVPSTDTDAISAVLFANIANLLDATGTPPDCDPTAGGCGPPTVVFTPAGWSAVVDTSGTNAVIFTASTPADPGAIVSGFGFFSTNPPGVIQYVTVSDQGVFSVGSTAGPVPASVPEPRTSAMGFWALVGLVMLFRVTQLRTR